MSRRTSRSVSHVIGFVSHQTIKILGIATFGVRQFTKQLSHFKKEKDVRMQEDIWRSSIFIIVVNNMRKIPSYTVYKGREGQGILCCAVIQTIIDTLGPTEEKMRNRPQVK